MFKFELGDLVRMNSDTAILHKWTEITFQVRHITKTSPGEEIWLWVEPLNSRVEKSFVGWVNERDLYLVNLPMQYYSKSKYLEFYNRIKNYVSI